MTVLFRIFFEFFKLSLFVVGGGYAIIAVADSSLARKGWTEEGELMERLPVFQMVPGLIATHIAVYVGRKIAGVPGAVVAVAAVVTPSVAVFSAVAAGYGSLPLDNALLHSVFVGLRAALAGIIAAAVFRSWASAERDVFFYSVFSASVFALFCAVPVPAVLLVSVAAGIFSRARFSAGRRRFFSSFLPLLLFLKYGSLCFGGGFVLVPMYIEDFVGAAAPYLNIAEQEFSDLMALTQMTPGPIGINGATYFGYRLAGPSGAVAASVFMVLPGSVAVYFLLRSLESFKTSRIVAGVMRGARPASLALMFIALWAIAGMCVFAPGGGDGDVNFKAIAIILTATMIMIKKKPNAVALIALCATAAAVLRADEITPEKYPDADIVVVEETEKVKYAPDGTYESVSEIWTKILTEKGRREQSTQRVHYSKRYGEAAITYVGIKRPGAAETEIDVSSTTKEATDNSSVSMNIYDPLDRIVVCTVPGLKTGDVLHVKTVRRALRPRCAGNWSGICVMQWSCPILKSTYEVTAPKELPIRRSAVRNPLGNVTVSEKRLSDGCIVHTFSCSGSEQAFPEPDMPPLYTQVQNVRLSTAENWQEISRWYWNLCVPRLGKTNAAMTNKVEELKREAAGDALVRAIFKFVSQEVRYMGLTMEDTSPGYAPHDVSVTFDNRYGVCRDKAVLLVAMLRIAGFNAFPVLINVGAKMDKEVPSPYFNHAIAAVEKTSSRGYVLMDPTDESTKDIFPSYLSDKSYLVCREEGEDLMTTPVLPSSFNSVDIVSCGKISPDGSMVLESEVGFSGINDTVYRGALSRRTPAERVELFGRIAASLSAGVELLSCDIQPQDMGDTEKALKAKMVLRVPEAVLKGESRIELSVPMISKKFGYVNFLLGGATSLEKRKFTLSLDTTARTRERLEIKLGDDFAERLFLPPDSATGGGYDYRRTMSVSGGVLTVERTLGVSKTEFSPEDYLKLKEDMKKAEAAERLRPVFAIDRCATADVEILLDRSETSILSPPGEPATEWVTTNETVQRVLTYEGKKSFSELKFPCHPLWNRVKVLSATVSNLNGRVYSVSSNEVNELDSGWAASAARYPAGKILVVNLPSVEIGSVVSVETETTVKGAPLPFYANFLFDSKSPVRRKIVRVGEKKREVTAPKRIKDEPYQPPAAVWRDTMTFSMCSWRDAAERLLPAVSVGKVHSLPEGAADIRSIRDWMARHVRVAGPSLYDLPVTSQLTDPEVVLKERYASRLDYVRTLAALLRKASYQADVVFAAADRGDHPLEKSMDVKDHPNPRGFCHALCKVTVSTGGFFGFGGEEKEYYLGTENEYTPLETTSFGGCRVFDPVKAAISEIPAGDYVWQPGTAEFSEWVVHEDGSVEIAVKTEHHGYAVGSFRKRFAEMLPENRSRFHQSLLEKVSSAAKADGELEVDVKGYPGTLRFKCRVKDYASVSADAITLVLPSFESALPPLYSSVRRTPFGYSMRDRSVEEVTVRFPLGYTAIEHLPEDLSVDERTCGFSRVLRVTEKDGALTVKVVSRIEPSDGSWFGPDDFAAQKDLFRRASSEAGRTIVVRREKSAPGKP